MESPKTYEPEQHGMGWRPSTQPPSPTTGKTKPNGGTNKNDVNNTKPNIIVKPPIAPPTGNNEFGFPVPQKF